MREIKFRAWDECGNRMMLPDTADMFLHFDGKLNHHDLGIVQGTENTPQIKLMQYTGLKDRNGVEIYEGDVVTAREQSDKATFTGRVHFLNAQYWVNYAGYESYYAPLIQLHNAVYKPIEVIGNIYEHPHLLEGSKSE